MLIKNTGKDARTLSRNGVDIPLLPGASVELPLTKGEADAFRGLGFDVSGDPEAKPAAKTKD